MDQRAREYLCAPMGRGESVGTTGSEQSGRLLAAPGDPSARPLGLVASLARLQDLETLDATLWTDDDWLEVRADLVGDVDPDRIRSQFPGRILYTLRSEVEGGSGPGPGPERRDRLLRASRGYDLVDLELEADASHSAISSLLEAVPEERRLLSWHGRFGDAPALDDLADLLGRQRSVGARYYKLVAAAETPLQAIPSLALQRSEGGAGDLISFAMGRSAAWSRILSVVLGSPLAYVAVGGQAAAPGQFTAGQLRSDYGFPVRPVGRRLNAILGWPVEHSLSPRLHNGGYRDLGLDALFIAVPTESFSGGEELFRSGALGELGFEVGGLAVTAPHKDAALMTGMASRRAREVGSANTLVATPDGWLADSTDPEGVVAPLRARGVDLSRTSAAVIGAGGAGRAAVWGLRNAGATVTLINRGARSGASAAAALGVPFVVLDEINQKSDATDFLAGFDVVVNATSLGHGDDDPPPLTVATLGPGAMVVEMVYRAPGRGETAWIGQARDRGLATICGREVLLGQAVQQFRAMTGEDLPMAQAAQRLGLTAGTLQATEPFEKGDC